ncbi:MAG TPA: ribose-phosphate pyrophosphokinase [Ktedonobacterales bacterium]|nr:ribose-phosphate pyrophosphokinase [Ktedonobacterales bacterium]
MSGFSTDEQQRPGVAIHFLGASASEVPDMVSPPCVLSGSSNVALAQTVASRLGSSLLDRRIEQFPDGEMYVRLGTSVRGRDAFIIQPTCAPVNDNLFELLLLLDALKRASAARLTAIIPYYGYARQDRKFTGREPITAKLVANLLAAAGATRIVAIDLHSPAIQGFFDIGMDHMTAIPLLCEYLMAHIPAESVIVSPDTGGVKRADVFARILNLPIAILHKRRASARQVDIAAVIGDIRDKSPIIVDDIIATGGTIRKAVDTLIDAGARPDVRIVATHGVFAGDALEMLNHPAISEIVVTDTIPVPAEALAALPALRVVSVAELLANAIRRLHSGLSLSELFSGEGAPPI